MRGESKALDLLLLNPQQMIFYLEVEAIAAFLSWLNQDTTRTDLLANGTWVVNVFKHQLIVYTDYQSRRRKLTSSEVGVKVLNDELKPQDSIFVDEFERTYFQQGVHGARQRAEFYLLVRRSSGNGWINIISQNRSFERVPMVNTYFVGGIQLTGHQGMPAQFDFFSDLNIHPEIRRAAAHRLQNGETALAIQQSVQNIYDYLRSLSGCTHDGQDLIIYCLSQDAWETENRKKRLVGTTPRLNCNPFTDSWEHEEQKGLREIGFGIQRILRNPLAHKPVTDTYITNRFSDEGEVLKLLCLISYFLERIDLPKP